MNFARKKKAPLEVSLTPMIDVVFLLLIFFMVTTTFNQLSVIKINLPKASGEETNIEDKLIMLTIDSQGKYFISGDKTAPHELMNSEPATLKRALIDAAAGSRSVPFIISADGDTPHQSVVTVIDIATQIGFDRVTFATKVIAK